MVAAGLLAALDLLASQPERLKRLWANTAIFRDGLKGLGFNTGASVTPIVPVMIGDAAQAATFARELRAAGVYAQAFSYPVVPPGKARIRCIISASHSQDDLHGALEAFGTIGRRIGLI